MTEPNQKQLLGYLLDALDDDEQESLDARLEYDDQCRRELTAWRQRLAPLEQLRPDYEPRPGLAERTCRFVAKQAAMLADLAAGRPKQGMTPLPMPPCRTSSFGWSDVAVLALLLLMTVTLVFPAICGSRFQSRVTTCQNDLRHFGLALGEYGNQQRMPLVRLANREQLSQAGLMAAPRIRDGYYSGSRMTWPAAWLAAQNVVRETRLATTATHPENTRGETWPGVSFAGKTDDGQFSSLPVEQPLLADAPSAGTSGQPLAAHGGLGRNVFFVSGRTDFVPSALGPYSQEASASILPVSLK